MKNAAASTRVQPPKRGSHPKFFLPRGNRGKDNRQDARLHRIVVFIFFGLVCGFLVDTAHAQQAKLSPAEREAKAREYFTDTLINFVFTQCGDACPLITAKLVQAKKDLGELFGSEVRFVSISIDPQHDRPQDLAKFARKFDAVHPEWLFLTGEPANVQAVVKKLGAWTEDIESHSTAIIIGSPRQGKWKKVRPDAPPKIIAEELRYFVAGEQDARKLAQGGASGR